MHQRCRNIDLQFGGRIRGRRGRGWGGNGRSARADEEKRKGISDRFIYGGNRDGEVKTL